MSAVAKIASPRFESVESRVERYESRAIGSDLNSFGCAVLENLLTPNECHDIASLFPSEEKFRSHIHMAQHGFGKGEYRYTPIHR
jgi:hypothetical protein